LAEVQTASRRTDIVCTANRKAWKMLEGMIKAYNHDRAFGFIRPDSGGEDVFFHLKSFPPGVMPEAGARVSYNLAPDQRSGKRQAVSVKVLAGGRSSQVTTRFVRIPRVAR
jgi:CspA family cold shock protein